MILTPFYTECIYNLKGYLRLCFMGIFKVLIYWIVAVHPLDWTYADSNCIIRAFRIGNAGLAGFISTNGTVVTKPTYPLCDDWLDGYAWVSASLMLNNASNGTFIDAHGKPISKPIFGDLRGVGMMVPIVPRFNGNFAVVQHGSNSYVYIDKQGRIVQPVCKWDIPPPIPVKEFVFLAGKKKGVINADGVVIVPPKYDYVELRYHDDWIIVMESGAYGVITKADDYLIEPVYQKLRSTRQPGIIAYFKDGKWGFMRLAGSFVTDATYDETGHSGHGLLAACSNGCWQLLDYCGNLVTTNCFDEIYGMHEYGARVRKDGHVGLVNGEGKFFVPCQYSSMQAVNFHDPTLFIVTDEGQKQGCVDIYGNLRVPVIYDSVLSEYKEDLIVVRKDKLYGAFSSDGRQVLPLVSEVSIDPVFQMLCRHMACRSLVETARRAWWILQQVMKSYRLPTTTYGHGISYLPANRAIFGVL